MALLVAGTIACSKDEKEDVTNNPTNTENTGNENGNNDPTPSQLIVGEWSMNKFDQDGDATTSSGTTMYTYVMTGSNFSGTFRFNSNRTYENTTAYDIKMVMTFSMMGDQTTNEHVELTDTGIWSFNADGDLVITSSVSNVTQTLEVQKLTKTELVLTGNVTDTQSQNGATITVTGNSMLSFSK